MAHKCFRAESEDVPLAGCEYRNRFREDEMTAHGMKVMAGRLTIQKWELVRHPKTHAANERFAKFLEKRLDNLFKFRRHPGADATNWPRRARLPCHPLSRHGKQVLLDEEPACIIATS